MVQLKENADNIAVVARNIKILEKAVNNIKDNLERQPEKTKKNKNRKTLI